MAIYAIGDIQGCFDALRTKLNEVEFDTNKDTLWLTGDLVARGPKSLKTLRYLFSIRDSVVSVLGNHDLHLLALAHSKEHRKNFGVSEDFQKILDAEDKIDLLDWLLHLPLMHYDLVQDTILSHAGVYPLWSLKKAFKCAQEVEAALLKEKNRNSFFANMYGNQPNLWDNTLEGAERLRFITNAFTRMRYVSKKARLDLKFKGQPRRKPRTLLAWFDYPNRQLADTKIVFGHWASLGHYKKDNIHCIDSGCVWGNELTLIKISD